MKPIYLDHAATTPLRPEVREAMLPFLEERFGNPSSIHRWGRESRAAIEEARARVAAAIGATPRDVVFTRGGTEADNLAILGRTRSRPGAPVVCSVIEHRAVLATARQAEREGSPLRLLPVDGEGRVREEDLAPLLAEEPAVVSVMWANNEIGTLQPVERLAALCAEADVCFHSDAIQALGKVEVRMDRVPVALLSMSAHKIGGPKGVGALFIRRGTALEPLVYGGGQEKGVRAGTEDVAGAVGLGVAAELAVRDLETTMARVRTLRDRLQEGLRERVPDLVVSGGGAERIPSTLNVSFPGADPEALLLTLDLEGIAVSSGSACSSGAVDPSHVLTAMGVPPELAGPSLRFSLGRETTDEEIDRVLQALPPMVERLRRLALR